MSDLLIGISKICDFCIQLLHRKEELNAAYFTHFVEPIQSNLDNLHEGYMTSFKTYRDLINRAVEWSDLNDTLVRQIQSDSIFSYSDRAKLRILTDSMEHPLVGNYVRVVGKYLSIPSTVHSKLYNGLFDLTFDGPAGRLVRIDKTNGGRIELMDMFRVLRTQSFANLSPMDVGADFKNLMGDTLDNTVLRLEKRYALVYREYVSLKTKLLV